MANRVADVCGESIIHGIASEISRQRAGYKCVCSGGHFKWFDFKTRDFFCKFDLAYLPCRLHPYRTSALYSNRSRIEMSVQKPVIIKF